MEPFESYHFLATLSPPIEMQFNSIKDEIQEASKKSNKPKRKRSKYSTDQISQLEAVYENEKYLTASHRKELSEAIGLTERQIKIWFQNRRTKERKQMKNQQNLEHQSEQYVEILIQNSTAETWKTLLDCQKTGTIFACPHEYFHVTTLKCPCAPDF